MFRHTVYSEFFIFMYVSATTEIYTYRHTLSLPDAHPIYRRAARRQRRPRLCHLHAPRRPVGRGARRRKRQDGSAAVRRPGAMVFERTEEHTSELKVTNSHIVCPPLLETKTKDQ